MTSVPLRPSHPERICWGCDQYCPEDSLACGNGTIRTPHPIELFGHDWLEWSTRDREVPGRGESADQIAADVGVGNRDQRLPTLTQR